ncbi:MAG: alpha/beta hydrolase [Novosphingobium sp.]|nr:alpha/beta hydrolase [Novosphingobium sp.]
MDDETTGHVPAGPIDPVAEQVAGFFATDPTWQAITTAPVSHTRDAIRAATPISGEPAMEQVEDFSIAVAGGTIALRHYRPTARPMAIIMWLHGGGFALGSIDESDNFARELASQTQCSVVTIDYRLAPEHKFPTAVEDALAAAIWVSAHRSDLAGSPVPVIVGGDSAGGNLATVATRKLHEAGEHSICANVLAYPATDVPDSPSLRRFDAPFLTVREVDFFHDQYLPDAASRHDPDFAPMLADTLDCLPPTLIITAEHDIITEQAEAYGGRLGEAGVQVRTKRYDGMIHGFLTADVFFPGAAGEALREITSFIKEVAAEQETQ